MENKPFVFRFSDVEVREREFSLVKAGEVIPVEPKAFRVLLFLLHNPQKLIAKEELLNAVWGETAVSENSLTRSIALLRRLLGEDTHRPRFIETVATVGYRLVCPVEVSEDTHGGLDSPTTAHIGNGGEPAQINGEAVSEAVPAKRPAKRTWTTPRRWLLAATILVVGLLASAVWYLRQPLPPPHISKTVRITNDARWTLKAVIGTDGSRVFMSLGIPFALGQVPASGGEITTTAIQIPNFKPILANLGSVAPDGNSVLVYGEYDPKETMSDIWVVGTTGSPIRYLARGFSASWSPDGRQVIYSTAGGNVYTIPSAGGEPHLLRKLDGPAGFFAYSPDGSRVRFVQAESDGQRLWEMSSNGANLHEVLPGWHVPKTEDLCCGRWMADGDFFIFLAADAATSRNVWGYSAYQIWAIDERRGLLRRPNPEPVQLTSGPTAWLGVIPSRNGRELFSEGQNDRGELIRYNRKTKQLEPYLGGISADWLDFSRDGKFVVYSSFPGNTLWRANRDGSDIQQVAKAPLCHPWMSRISPDGSQVVFDDFVVRPGPWFQAMYLASSQGGTPVRILPDDQSSEWDPTWSPDGKRLAFGPTGANSWNNDPKTDVRIVDLVTRKITYLPPAPKRARSPRWSPDGRYIVCLSTPKVDTLDDSLEVYDFKTNTWKVIVHGNGAPGWPAWSRDSRWIYYVRSVAEDHVVFNRISVDGGQAEPIADLPGFHHTGWIFGWFGLDPDENPLMLRDAGTTEVYALTLEEK